VADQTAVAIENDELTVELRKRTPRSGARNWCRNSAATAAPCPTIPVCPLLHCQPANRVGGDYYDFICTNKTRFSRIQEVIHSLSLGAGDWGRYGKGVPAALIMTMTRGMLRERCLRSSPALILQKLNRVMYADLETSHRFVTLFYSEYDPQTRILSYSNAAHNPPLLWQAATKIMDTLGMLIGLDAHSQ